MSNIAGWIDFKNPVTEQENKLKKFAGGVPGEGNTGEYISENCALFCKNTGDDELSPLIYELAEREYAVAFDGLIQNKAELARKLECAGFEVTAEDLDSEIVLLSFIHWGRDCLNIIKGAFAFVIWDAAEKIVFAARDFAGIKPLFYHSKGNVFAFSGSIDALLSHPEIPAKIDRTGLAEIFLIGPGRTCGNGIFTEIQELPPGCCLFAGERGVRREKYFELQAREHTDTIDVTVQKIRQMLGKATDVLIGGSGRTGCFLSGGLDSSILTAITAGHYKHPINTFSVQYEDDEQHYKPNSFETASDIPFVREMSEYLGTEHRVTTVGQEELAGALFDAMKARGLPGMADVDSSLLLFCRGVSEYLDIAVSGECADEIFGGYPWYHNPERLAADGFPWSLSVDYRAGFLKNGILGELNPADYSYSKYAAGIAAAPKLEGESAHSARMREMYYLNIYWFMQTLLERSDRMARAAGIEIRVPFCDREIVDYMYNVPWEMKALYGREKGLLREACGDLLPHSVLWRKKSPYPKTHNPRYLELVRGMLREIMSDSSAPLREITDPAAVSALLAADIPVPWYGQLMTTPQTIAYFIQIDLWLRHYNINIV